MKNLKKILLVVMILSMASVYLAGCGGASGKVLNLYTWDGMFPKEVLEGFTKETGIEINYNNFDTDETMLAKLNAAKGGEYDLIIADDYIIKTAIDSKLVKKLDMKKLDGEENIDEKYRGLFYDPNNEYTVPYGAGIQTIVYNPAKVKKEIAGYADLWDSSLKGRVGIVTNFRVIDGMALKINGKSYNESSIAAIEEAGKKLNELAPNIRLIKDSNLQDDLLSGEIDAGVMYTSQVTLALRNNPDLKVVFPKEGIGFGVMAGFIPVKAPNSDAAYKFLNYILKPENAAKCISHIGYYSTNKEAVKKLSDEDKKHLTLPENLIDMEMIKPLGAAAEEAHSKIWTTFKNKTGK